MTLPEPCYAVPDLIPEGLSLLAGKPKLGKSWLILAVLLAIAMGGVVLGFHQSSARASPLSRTRRYERVQKRLRAFSSSRADLCPKDLTSTTWPRQEGRLKDENWIARQKCQIIAIELGAKFRPRKTGGEPTKRICPRFRLKAVADKWGVADHGTPHCRKLEASDPITSVSGTLGLTGCADTICHAPGARKP